MEDLTLKNNIVTVTQIIEDLEYQKSRARSPRIKREKLGALKFWRNLLSHLDELKGLREKLATTNQKTTH